MVTNGSRSEEWVGGDIAVVAGIGGGVRWGVAHALAPGLSSESWSKGDHVLVSAWRAGVMTVVLS